MAFDQLVLSLINGVRPTLVTRLAPHIVLRANLSLLTNQWSAENPERFDSGLYISNQIKEADTSVYRHVMEHAAPNIHMNGDVSFSKLPSPYRRIGGIDRTCLVDAGIAS